MSRTLDIEKVDAALKRAANRATYGTREERSGRFLPARKRSVSSADRTVKRSNLSRRKA
jgi:hypothetical protein